MKYYFEGRATGRGAYTSAGGRQFEVSRSGNHWREVVDAEVGGRIYLVDISNSGKHDCRVLEVQGDGSLITVAQPEQEWCPVCDRVPATIE